MTGDEVMWMVRFITNTTRHFRFEDAADNIAFACERGDDPWEAAVAMEEGTWSAEGPKLTGIWVEGTANPKGGTE